MVIKIELRYYWADLLSALLPIFVERHATLVLYYYYEVS